MRNYILCIFLIGQTSLTFGTEELFKGQPLPSNVQELYDQSKTFLTTLDSLIGDLTTAQEDFFKANENNERANRSEDFPNSDSRDIIQSTVPNGSLQNNYLRRYITKYIPTKVDMLEEKWSTDLYFKGVDFSKLKENFSVLVGRIEAIKPQTSSCLPYFPFDYFWQKFKFSSNLSTIRTDLKNLLPSAFFTVKVGDASFITTTDPQYGEQSKTVVYFTPAYQDGELSGKDNFNITLPLIPNYTGDSIDNLIDLFSWPELVYGGGTMISQQMADGSVTETWFGKTYPGRGGLKLEQFPGEKYHTLQASYSINDFRNITEATFSDRSPIIETYNRRLNLKGDPTAVFVARSKLLKFITAQVIP